MSRTYAEAVRLLNSLQSNFAITSLFSAPASSTPSASSAPKPDLNALAIPEMLHWLKRAGYTPSDLTPLKTVHISGTKGKGSVTALTSAILLRYPGSGRVGTYTSPHLVTVRERIMIDGKPITQELFTKYFFDLWDRFEASAAEAGEKDVQGPGSKPFYFRYLTIMAWHVFLAEGVKSMVMECGIGGEYDATNLIPAEAVTAAVVTQLGIDHVFMLGDTVEKIAWHKAGIFKEGVKAFTRKYPGRDGESVLEVLKSRASEKGADLVEIDDGFADHPQISITDAKLNGPFQKWNRALACWAAREHLGQLGENLVGKGTFEAGRATGSSNLIPDEFVEGLKTASLRGRSEVFWDEKNQIEWWLDGAHNHDSLRCVGDWFADVSREPETKRALLFNQQERNAADLLTCLWNSIKQTDTEEVKKEDGSKSAPAFDLAIFSRNEPDAVDGQPAGDLTVQVKNCQVMGELDGRTEAITQTAVRPAVEALKTFAKTARDEGRPCKVLVTGSFHLVGAVIRCIDPNVED